MKRLAFLIPLVVGGATASASPYHHHWTQLADKTVANRDHRNIDAGGRVFQRIRLETVGGEPLITAIAMQYQDGTNQFIRLNRPFDYNSHPRELDLNRGLRRISRIVVYTDPSFQGRFAVYGT